MNRLLLCTDMDRTVIPNGAQPVSADALPRLHALCRDPRVTLVYVSGRHRQLVAEAIEQYQLPAPDYVIADVGTTLYQCQAAKAWHPLDAWVREIDPDWAGYDHGRLAALFADLDQLELQEPDKQNSHKLSYYLPLTVDREPLLATMAQRLQQRGIAASLVWSIDEPADIGLLDVLPRNATKLHAIEFLRQQLGFSLAETVFAGDSGNDLPVLASAIPSVLVANASAEVRDSAQQQATAQGHAEALYLAHGTLGMNGNYAAGLLEGVWHFAPAFRPLLEESP